MPYYHRMRFALKIAELLCNLNLIALNTLSNVLKKIDNVYYVHIMLQSSTEKNTLRFLKVNFTMYPPQWYGRGIPFSQFSQIPQNVPSIHWQHLGI